MFEKTVFLVGDIGGTNSRLGLYDIDANTKLIERHYKNCEVFKDKNAGSFERFVLEPFLKECWSSSGIKDILPPIESAEIIACLACAGIVRDNKVVLTNLGGVEVNGNDIEKNNDVNIPRIKRLLIINDFVAQGYGCLTLKSNEVEELTEGSHDKVEEYGPKVCVGAGTGLGECFLTWNGNGYKCYPSEGGHTEFNPRTKLEIEMRENLMKKFGYLHRLSIERVVSGMGLADVYEFLASAFKDRVDSIVHDQFLKAENEKAKIVADNCGQELCKLALDIMMR
jgi:glucokinase